MERYLNLGGNSNVIFYEIHYDYIDVEFRGGPIYRYSYISAGMDNVEIMKKLAEQGYGLNSYINRNVRLLYECKF